MSAQQAQFLTHNGMTRASRTKAQINLRDQVKHPVLFPRGQPPQAATGRRGQDSLPKAAKLWPTPTARDYKDGSKSSCANVPVNGLLGRAVHAGSQADGQLSATWTEALMGYPRNWTDLEKNGSFANRYPAAWLNGKWEAGVPRVITGQQDRTRRIKALGNSIVPQIPYLIFLSQEFDRWR
jgi:hypothetical protein